MRYIVSTAILVGAGLAFASESASVKELTAPTPAKVRKAEPEPKVKPAVQIAILLDTSSSMDGLIDQARTQLWKIVNEMTLAKQNGQRPNIQIALYEYGNSNLAPKDNYIRRVLPFTDDLDGVSEALHKLTTDGGLEYCGAVIDCATKELEWNKDDKNALKMIFIAGNEPFSQGSVDHKEAIRRALQKGITVNTIYCGSERSGEAKGWKTGAQTADGSFVCIDHNATPPIPETPYDKELAELSTQLNGTYIAYGGNAVREEKERRQVAQDAYAGKAAPSAVAERAKTKASKLAYNNSSWDLVDAFADEQNSINISGLQAKNELPEELKGKSEMEIRKFIEQKASEREEIQNRIKAASEKRDGWLLEKQKETAAEPSTLDKAIIESVRKQAGGKQFEFDKK